MQSAQGIRARFHQGYVKKYFNSFKNCHTALFQQVLNGKLPTPTYFICFKN